jgi:AraC-like DNA-binding protein
MAQRVLFKDCTVAIFDVCCDGFDSRCDEQARNVEIIFVRSGVFRIETERGYAIADPSRAVFLRPGERYRITHPGPSDDRCLVMTMSPQTLDDLLAIRATGAGEVGFPRLAEACDAAVYAAQRRLTARLERDEDSLSVAEESFTILRSLSRSWRTPALGPRLRGRDDDERVSAVRALLAHRFADRISLAEIGDHVGLSPFRLAHVFRAETGSSIHQYRLDLRLRSAVERLAGGDSDLTELALDLGFSDHAHFSNTFRRRFGIPPSVFRSGTVSSN